MTYDEALKELDEMDEELCNYCKYSEDCSKGVSGGPSGPIYPPCADGCSEDYIDVEAYIEAKEVQ